MANRNMEKIASETHVPARYQMVAPEFCRVHDMCKNGKEFEAYVMLFNYGFALGCRATKRGVRVLTKKELLKMAKEKGMTLDEMLLDM